MNRPLNQDDVKTVAKFLAPFYKETPQETENYINNMAFAYPDARTFETRGFVIWDSPIKRERKVNVANHFFNARSATQIVVTNSAIERKQLADFCLDFGYKYKAIGTSSRNAFPQSPFFRLGRVVYEVETNPQKKS